MRLSVNKNFNQGDIQNDSGEVFMSATDVCQ